MKEGKDDFYGICFLKQDTWGSYIGCPVESIGDDAFVLSMPDSLPRVIKRDRNTRS